MTYYTFNETFRIFFKASLVKEAFIHVEASQFSYFFLFIFFQMKVELFLVFKFVKASELILYED